MAYRLVWWAGVSSIVALGIVVAVARLGLPVVSEYRVEVEQQLRDELGINLAIGAVEAEWHGIYPELRVTDLSLLDEQGRPNGVRFDQMRITLNLWMSWLQRRLQPQDLELSGLRLQVERDHDGKLQVKGWRASGTATDWNRVADWVLQHRLIKFTDARVLLEDSAGGLRFAIDDAALYLLTIGDGHRLTASATLAPHPDSDPTTHVFAKLSVAADLVGGQARFDQGKVYLAVDDIELEQPDTPWLPIVEGQSIRLWTQRSANRWSSLKGEMRGLLLRTRERGEPLRLADTVIDSRQSAGAWHTTVAPLQVPEPVGTGLWLDWTGANADDAGELDVRIDRVQAQVLSTLLAENSAVPASLREALAALTPKGALVATHFNSAAGDRMRFSTRFSNFYSEYWQGIPQLSDVGGGVSIDTGSGRVTVNAGGGRIRMGDLFPDSWPLDHLQVDMAYSDDERERRLALHRVLLENRDLALEVRGDVRLPRHGDAPFLDLIGAYYRGGGARLWPYMPIEGVSANTRAWLREAIVAGTVTGGGLVLRGRADQFPFVEAKGMFETSFDVAAAEIDYAEGWPRLEGVDAEVEFRGGDMAIHAVGGRILDADMRRVEISLPGEVDGDRTVFLDGELALPISEVRAFILGSPLAGRYSTFVDELNAKGDGALHIKLELPLGHPENNKVSGALDMHGADLHWTKAGLLLERVDGVLAFDSDGLQGKGIRARLFGQAVTVDVGSGIRKGVPMTLIELSGKLDEALLQQALGKAYAAYLRGRSRWRATIGLPKDARLNQAPEVSFESSLKGLAIDLPWPLAKAANSAIPMRIGTRLEDGRYRRVRFGLGDRLGGEVEIDRQTGSLRRGVLNLGRGEVRLPDTDLPDADYLLVQGRLDSLSVDPWLAVIEKLSGNRTGADADWLREVDISIGRLELFGQRYANLAVRASRRKKAWVIALAGEQIKGKVVLPDSLDAVVTVDLERLHMKPPGDQRSERGGRPADPRSLPSVNIRIQSFVFDKLPLGSLTVIADKVPKGLEVRTFALKSPLLTLAAEGLWEMRKRKQYSECHIEFSTDSLGGMLAQMGFANTVSGGATKGRIDAHWAGPPADFALGRINGSFNIDIGPGSLLQIDPGAGRIFGLLSPQVFTRQLGKRYAGLAKKGFYFESISGKYRLQGGNAYSESMHVNGPVARIDISGRIGLLARDYNQYVEVIPRVSSGLTLATGAVAIGNPPLGAALLLAQTMFGEKLDTISARYYLISGGWDDPQVTRLKRPR